MNTKYYVYLHIKSTNGEPFYVGKGKNNRAFEFNKKSRSKHWNRIKNKYGVDVIFIENNLTEPEAFEKEIYWIKRIGRKDLKQGPLVNFTNGGEGTSGYKFSEELLKKMSEINSGENNPFFNKKHTQETKYKMISYATGRKHSEKTKDKIRQKSIGRIFSEETRNKLSELSKKQMTEEAKMNLSIKNKGKKLSEEHKNKISKSTKIITRICPHCNKEGKGNAMLQWHFDKCKMINK